MSRILGVPYQSPLRYMPEKAALIPIVRIDRLPLTSDKNFPVAQFWLIDRNPTTGTEGDLYYLERFDVSGDAIWTKLADVSGISGLQKITGDTGFAVIDASDNIDVVGAAAQGVSTSAAVSTVTVTVADATSTTKGVSSFNATDFTVAAGAVTLGDTIVKLVSSDSGDATPASNTVTITGGSGITTSAVGSTITISAAASVAGAFVTDAGTATPVLNTLNVLGGTGVNTAGAGDTVTVNIDSPVTVANGGTGASTLTDGGILLGSGTGAVTVTAQPTDGQLLIGSTGVDPVLATLTDGTGISIVEGAGTITIGLDGTVTVPNGGTGNTTFTPYTVITAGTTATGAFQNVASVGSSGQVLTSNGAGALPTFQNAGTGVIGPNIFFIQDDFIIDTDQSPFTCSTDNQSANTKDNMGIIWEADSTTFRANTEQNILVDGGEIIIKCWAVFQPASIGRVAVGLTNHQQMDIASLTRGVYFAASASVYGGNIYAVTKNAAGTTATDTGVANSSTYRFFQITINDDASSCLFEIDGATVATHTTNIPANNVALYGGWGGQNTGGVASILDYLSLQKTYTGARA